MKKHIFWFMGFIFFLGTSGFCAEISIRVPEGSEYAPFFIRDKGGRWKGLSIELVEALLVEAGQVSVYVPMPFARGLKSMKNGTIDMMLNMTITEDRKKFMFFIGPQLDETIYLVIRNDADFSIASLDDLKKLPKAIGVERGKVYSKTFEKKRAVDKVFKNHLEEVNEVDLNERKLEAGRISGFIGFGYNVLYQINNNPHYKNFTVHPFKINQDNVYFGFSKKNFSKDRLGIFQQAYDRANRKGEFEKIKKQYRIH